MLRPFREHRAIRRAIELFGSGEPGVAEVAGPTGVTTTLLAAAAALSHPGPVLLLTAFEDQARAATADLLNLARGSGRSEAEDTHLVVAPFDELGPRDLLGARAEGPLARRLVLAATLDHRRSEGVGRNVGRWIVVASAAALLQALPPEDAVASAVMRLHPGDDLSAAALAEHLADTGHRRTDGPEDAPGAFHLSGNGDAETVRFRPLAAVATDADGRTSTAGRAAVDVAFETGRIASIRFVDPPTDAWTHPLAALTLATPEAARILQRDSTRSLPELFPDHAPGEPNLGVVIDDGEAVTLELARRSRRADGGSGTLTPGELNERLAARPRLVVNGPGPGVLPGGGDAGVPVRLDAVPAAVFDRAASAAAGGLAARAEDHRVLVVSDGPDEPALQRRLKNADAAQVCSGVLSRGFHLRGASGLEAIPAHELLRRAAPPEAVVEDPQRTAPPSIDSLSSVLIDLEEGDPLVHADHGVALYRGMEPVAVGIGSSRVEVDHLTLAFAEPDVLRVPADQAARVFPFHATDDLPKPDPLNGKAWQKKVAAAEAAASAFVRETRRAAAEAKSRPGRGHPTEPKRLRAFADAFPFEPTADQAAAFEAVAADLAAEEPMDRLICGDVGFGKTEVAAHAIFRTVRPRKRGTRKGTQAALLAPTTVLAEQHGRSLGERLRPFGVSVATLSRLCSAEEAEEIRGQVRDGSLDLVIGTTALLSENIAFDDLGLVVVDEEHRFGTADKEALGGLGDGVDRLSLTATPIPRTLHTALAGLRDVSTLRTAPPGRKPVVTEVLEADPARVQAALRRELFRGGQAFVVHNRVKDLDEATEEVRGLLGGVVRPDGEPPVVASAHGQLGDEELEDTLLRFADGGIDVLVCTTIVENGLDVARAGTVVIRHAERFGLAALHQLRGRVGRAVQRGFCLLEVPRNAQLSEGAARRLSAMEDADALGSGFDIAEADLAVRGAGDLLGQEQSGHVAAVGHGLYSRMIERAARVQAGDLRPAPEVCGLHLPGTGSLPAAWIPPTLARLNACRWLTHVDSEDQLGEAVERLEETWGDLPPEAERFVAAVRLRLAMADVGVTHAAKGKEGITFTLVLPADRDRHEAHREEVIQELNGGFEKERFRPGLENDELLYHPPPEVEDEQIVEHLTGLLQR